MLEKMGSFLSALRKAKGLSQMELAERLNVSDKTVSRWERGKGSPDLCLIPVLADIFEVTSDELLRGERINPVKTSPEDLRKQDQVSRKQSKRLLRLQESRFKNRSLLALGILFTGLLAAMICNFGFLRASLGFFLAVFLYGAGILLEILFLNTAWTGSLDESLDSKEADAYKRSVTRRVKFVFYTGVLLLAVTLPLILAGGPYLGLNAGSWFSWSLLFGGLALVALFIFNLLLTHLLVKKRIYPLDPGQEVRHHANEALKRRLAPIFVLAFFVIFVAQALVNDQLDSSSFSPGTSFADFESFKAFMEKEEAAELHDGQFSSNVEYYDEEGRPLPEEEALREYFYDRDGQLVGSYIARNQTVALFQLGSDQDPFLIRLHTVQDLAHGHRILDLINLGFGLIYLVVAVVLLAVYYKKRQPGPVRN